jgi:polysaccharide export outer membrane protein
MKKRATMLHLFTSPGRLAAFLLLTAFGLTGCAANNLPRAPENVTPVTPMATDLAPYRIQIADIIEIKMSLNPEFEEELIVRPDGMISTSLAQDVKAYGQTPQDLQSTLVELYKEQLSDPQLTVSVRSFAPSRVYVLGEVNAPGEFVSVGPNLTLLQAIARAGGVKNSAMTSQITILRRGASDKSEALAANYDEAVSGKNPGAMSGSPPMMWSMFRAQLQRKSMSVMTS